MVYVNGDLENSVPATGMLVPSDTDLFIGRHAVYDARYFNGNIDEVSIRSRALSAGEIAEYYAMTWQNYLEKESKIGHWRFNEGIGQITHDSSSNNNNGTLGNSSDPDAHYLLGAAALSEARSSEGASGYLQPLTPREEDLRVIRSAGALRSAFFSSSRVRSQALAG